MEKNEEKFLYFQEAKAGSNVAADEVAMYPLSSFLGFDTQAGDTNGTTLTMRFKPMRRSALVTFQGSAEADDAVGEETDAMKLAVVANSQKSVMASILDKMNEPFSRDNGFIVVANVVDSEFLNSNITSVVVSVRTATAD